jgi:hypothetical protein
MESGLQNQLSTLTGGQQTMSSWARVIESYEAIPQAYRGLYNTVLGNELSVPYTVFAPAISSVRRKSTEKLLCEMNNTIHIWERIGEKVDAIAYPMDTISDLEIGNVLLYSWLTISGVTKSGAPASTTVEFNAATGRHLARFIESIRPAPAKVEERETRAEQDKFNYLSTENFKFMNFGRKSLVDGEKVLQIILQPKIYKPRIVLGGHILYQTTLSVARLTILTDKELIIIQDDEHGMENGSRRYGGKWNYIALNHIQSVEVPSRDDGFLTLCLTLSPGTRHIEFIFTASQRENLTQLKDKLEKAKM